MWKVTENKMLIWIIAMYNTPVVYLFLPGVDRRSLSVFRRHHSRRHLVYLIKDVTVRCDVGDENL